MRRRGAAVLLAVAGLCLPAGATAQESRLTIYSSLPLQGAARPQTTSVVNGARMALDESGGRAGAFTIRYLSLDDSTAAAGAWSPEQTARNARKAAEDESTIGYLGEFNSGATAVSLPLLNSVGIPQISPSNAYPGLTVATPFSDPGEPDKYYPTGSRTFLRMVPHDRVQAAAVAELMRKRGCRRAYFLHDAEVYGHEVASWARDDFSGRGRRALGIGAIDSRASNYRRLARTIRRMRARCVMFGGITANNAPQLFKDVARGLPRAQLFAADGVAESGFADPREGGVPANVGRRIWITVATLAPSAYPEKGRRFFERYRERYGEAADPYALHGYDAMQLLLEAVARHGADRHAVVSDLFAVRDHDGGLGRYGFDANGDTTLRDYGVYRIRRGELVFHHVIRPVP